MLLLVINCFCDTDTIEQPVLNPINDSRKKKNADDEDGKCCICLQLLAFVCNIFCIFLNLSFFFLFCLEGTYRVNPGFDLHKFLCSIEVPVNQSVFVPFTDYTEQDAEHDDEIEEDDADFIADDAEDDEEGDDEVTGGDEEVTGGDEEVTGVDDDEVTETDKRMQSIAFVCKYFGTDCNFVYFASCIFLFL
jgi:hypothetical protein